MRVPLPSAGCFKASYPSMTWERIACSKPSDILRALARQALFTPGNEFSAQRNSNMPMVIGSGKGNYFVLTTSNISMAIGSFPKVTGVTSIRTENPGSNCSGNRDLCTKNAWGLQINTPWYSPFSTVACNAAEPRRSCAGGWEQFLYTQAPKAYGNKGGNLASKIGSYRSPERQ